MPTMQLNDIQSSTGFMEVEQGGQPPPVPVGNRGAIASGDVILAAADASATVQNTANNDAAIITLSGDDPPSIEVNWEEVSQVDEYYNPTTSGYDYWITTADNDLIQIRS